MQDFEVTKEHDNNEYDKETYRMNAENDLYNLSWVYLGDYLHDKENGHIQNPRMVVNVTAKKPELLDLIYSPGGDMLIKMDEAYVISLSKVDNLITSLGIAREAAEKTISFMKQFISNP